MRHGCCGAQSLANELGPDHHVQVCDVTDVAALEDFGTTMTDRFGAPDLLVNMRSETR